MNQNERDITSELIRRGESADVPETEVHTYADGSQRVGVPPFPKLSPLQERDGVAAPNEPEAQPMRVPQGMKTSGAPAPSAAGNLTDEQFRAKVAQQVESDVTSGKAPDTPNPTTSSDKPELAGVGAVVDGLDPADPDDLAKLTKGVDADVDATQEQIDAAATQVARETRGVVTSAAKTAAKTKQKS